TNTHDVAEMALSPEFYTSLARDVSTAKYVTNTFVGTRHPGTKDDAVLEVYKSFVSGQNAEYWRDIVGISEVFSPRYTKLTLEGGHAEVRLKVLRHSPPIINFILIEYESAYGIPGFTEVYFGWMQGEQVGKVFYSRRTRVISYFKIYLQNLIDSYQWSVGEFD